MFLTCIIGGKLLSLDSASHHNFQPPARRAQPTASVAEVDVEAIADAVMARVEAKLDTLKDTVMANNQTLLDQIKAMFGQQAPSHAAAPLPPPALAIVPEPVPEPVFEVAEGMHV